MLKALGDLVTFNWMTVVAAVGKLLNDATLIQFDYANWLISIVNRADSSCVELALKGSFLLLYHLVGQLEFLVVSAINAVPDKAKDIFTGAAHFLVDFLDCILTFFSLLVALVDQAGELVQFIAPQETNVHEVDQSSAVFKLLSRLIKTAIQLLDTCISKLLLHCVDESFKGQREGGTNRFEALRVHHICQAHLD